MKGRQETNQMKSLIAASVAVLTLAAGCARAEDAAASGDRISLADFQARRVAEMMRADADHDGKLSKAEFTAALQARMAARGGEGGSGDAAAIAERVDRMFGRMDRDSDGFISQAEVEQSAADRFARIDVDHKGYVTADQMH